MNKVLLTSAVAILVASPAFAQSKAKKNEKTSETAVKLEQVAPPEATKPGNDIDEEITNAKLRAESGSKSKWSGSFAGSYSGGSMEKPLSKNRPNPTAEVTPQRVTMGGDMNVRYRANKNESVTLGVGVSLERPFQEAKRGDVTNPSVAYNYAGKVGTVQSITSGSVTAYTDSDMIKIGSIATVGASETLMYDIGSTGLSVGLAAEAYYTFYGVDKDKMVKFSGSDRTQRAGSAQEDYQLAAYPLIEYAVTDRLSLRTVFRPWIYTHGVDQAGATFRRRPWTQSFGVGYALTRDIYLYPNFQWDVENWRANDYSFADKQVRNASTVGLSAIINVF